MNNSDEHTFRAKRRGSGEWVYGYYLRDVSRDMHYIAVLGEWSYATGGQPQPLLAEIDPDTLCRSTGQPDAAGVMIFEKDVVRGLEYADFYTGIDAECDSLIVWDPECASFLYDAAAVYRRHMGSDVLMRVEIRGNIIDSPELDPLRPKNKENDGKED